jgi:transposase, IS5 family
MQGYTYIWNKRLHMFNYTSQYQTKITEFNNLYSLELDISNRWIQLGFHLPWDTLVKIYKSKFSEKQGCPVTNPRWIIGGLIIKHILNLSDEETLQTISENPYMQFFLDCNSFCPGLLFSPTVFVDIRKRLGNEIFNQFSDELIKICLPEKFNNEKTVGNKGELKIDATVADQYIRYPNDLGLLNEAREKTEEIIDELFENLRDKLKLKPRTYRKVAHKKYMSEAKKRQKNKKTLRVAIRYMLNCLDRNIRSINKMLDMLDGNPLTYNQIQQFWIIQTINDQQRKMYREKTNRCDNRIVSISQPHVRPILRGKQGKRVEFGSKLGLSLANGFLKADTLSWDAYNESKDLIIQAEAYKSLYGYYPELILADKIYATNQNRKWCKENDIRLSATPKGRAKKQSAYQKAKRRKEYGRRNQIEGKIGQSKQGYGLNQIKAKLKNTAETWIGMIIFVANLVKFAQLHNFRF